MFFIYPFIVVFFIKGSLIANMVLGIIYLKKELVWAVLITIIYYIYCFRYPKSKYIAVMMITVGIMLATLASANQVVSLSLM